MLKAVVLSTLCTAESFAETARASVSLSTGRFVSRFSSTELTVGLSDVRSLFSLKLACGSLFCVRKAGIAGRDDTRAVRCSEPAVCRYR